MFRPTLASLCLFVGLILTPHLSPAAWWWPFGADDEWRTMEPALQDANAAPIYDSAITRQAEGKLSAAQKRFQRVWKDFPGSRYAPEALYRYAVIQKQRKKWKPALEAYQRLIRFYPESPYFNDVVADMFEIGTAFEEGDNIRFLGVFPSRNYERAIGAYERVVSNAPYSEYAPIALMRVALIHRRDGSEVLAVDALDRLINNYPNSMMTADAYLLLAETFADDVDGPAYDQGATREAMSYYRDFLILFPTNPSVKAGEEGLGEMREVYARSKLEIGEFYYHYRDNYSAAEVFFNEAITIAPESNAAEVARLYLNRIEKVKAEYPQENWPRRDAWDYLKPWSRGGVAGAGVPHPSEHSLENEDQQVEQAQTGSSQSQRP